MKKNRFESYLERAGLARKPHQFEAVEWCLDREVNGRTAGGHLKHRGGLIADEMGLGKTIQMLGTMASNPLLRTLIVVPLPLLDQWVAAAERGGVFVPLVFHGQRKRGIGQTELDQASVVITTYGTLSSSIDLLSRKVWSRLICDEAHRLRNPKTRTHKSVAHLRARIRWFLTGTPVQNSKRDFYSLCRALGLRPAYFTRRSNLPELARHFVLKRTKAGVGLGLPPLDQEQITVGWQDETEARLAADIHAHLGFSKVSELGGAARGAASRGAFGEHHLAMLVRARQACVHPPLLAGHLGAMVEAAPADKDWLSAGLEKSSKIQAVAEHIRGRSGSRSRKLVFCHFRGEIDALTKALAARGISASSLDGRTPLEERKEILEPRSNNDPVAAVSQIALQRRGIPIELIRSIKQWLSGPEVLLLQIQTGCEGLNLQRFNEVYFVSPHWNPAVEDQAVARCHRLGQQKPVRVFRFTMQGFDAARTTISMEDYTKRVQLCKRRLVDELETDAREGERVEA